MTNRKFVRYLFSKDIPIESTEVWDHIAVRAAGFCPSSPAIELHKLSVDWNGHKKGSLIISEQLEPGKELAIEV